MKTAFIFPGQGAQYVGMADDFIGQNQSLVALLDDFKARTGYDLANIMSQGPQDVLTQTWFTQPAILLHSYAAWAAFNAVKPWQPDYMAGHSLGEFTALTVAGAIKPADALYLVHKRGEFMIKANQGTPFAMAAILGLPADKVKEICLQAQQAGVVIAANFNTPVQTVVSGSAAGVEEACNLAKQVGAKRTLNLPVGGPFHSPLIQQASAWLAEEMEKVEFLPARVPVVSNYDARPATDPAAIKAKLTRQIVSGVRWTDDIQFMIDKGVTHFIEFGPQKVLAGMMRQINPDAKVASVDKLTDIEPALALLEE